MKELIRPAERRVVVFPPIPCVEEAKARAETLKEEKAEDLSQLQSALTTSRHALKAMKAVDMRWKCEE